MMLTIQTDDRVFRAPLEALYRRLGNLTPVMHEIGMRLESQVSGRFETRMDPAGRAWAPWSPVTVESYPEDGNRKLLDRYSVMLLSLTSEATKDSVRIGFGQAYQTYHEYGTVKMPRRGLLFADPEAGTMGEEDEAEVLDVIGLYLTPD
jgi:phage virion morphogenesis protein